MTRQKRPAKTTPKSRSYALGLKLASARLPRHSAFLIALGVGIVVFGLTLLLAPVLAVVFGAISLFVTYLVLIGLMLPVLSPEFLHSRADEADTPAPVIFIVVIGVVALCCATLFMALNGEQGPLLAEVALSIASVLLGWFVIHTMAAMHYAYEYYESSSASPGAKTDSSPVGGLDFPEGGNPDGVAFLYFAYVIGTAFAVSDIRVTSNKMRKLVLLHSTFSYFFNTLIVAATVNVAVAVGNV